MALSMLRRQQIANEVRRERQQRENKPTVAYDEATGEPYCVVEGCRAAWWPCRHIS